MKIAFTPYTQKDDLYPFTLTRDVLDIRLGILTLREKWELLKSHGVEVVDDNELSVSRNTIPSLQYLKKLEGNINAEKKLEHPWQIFQYNDAAIREDFELITKDKVSEKVSVTNKIIGENIFSEEGVKMEHCIINSTTGPVYIGKNAEIMEGTIIRGPVAICEGSIIKMGAKIYGATTIGPYCIAGGEIKNTVMFGYSNKAHDGYLGDSVIGEWCNLGAGTSTSNVKNTAGEVKVWEEPKKTYTNVGLKCGLLMGDYSRAAINTSFNTGTVTGAGCNIFSLGFPPKFVQSFMWGDVKYELNKSLEHIDNWKKIKGHSITEKEKNILSDIYHQINKNA